MTGQPNGIWHIDKTRKAMANGEVTVNNFIESGHNSFVCLDLFLYVRVNVWESVPVRSDESCLLST